MEERRRSIELDEIVVDALEKRAAERGVSLQDHIVELASSEVVALDCEDRAELDARMAEWDGDHLGYEAADVFDWSSDRLKGIDRPFPQLKRF